MPKTKTRAFIDKKKALSFHLVHRSQRDPLIADGDAPQHVLVESSRCDVSGGDSSRHRHSHLSEWASPESPLNIPADPTRSIDKDQVGHLKAKTSRKEEQAKYGVYFDDDYDYLQHLKTAGATCLEPNEGFRQIRHSSDTVVADNQKKVGRINFPSSLFPSEIEDNIGLLNRAAPIKGPQPDLDPDILEALQSDNSDCEDSDGSFDDEFVAKANARLENESSSDSSDVDQEDCFSAFADEETKSRFTNYSMSSSALPRNDGLTLLDDRFEKIFEEYDDERLGALDGEDVDGYLTTGDPLIESVIDDYKCTFTERKSDDNKPKNISDESHLSSESDDGESDSDSGSDNGSEQMVKICVKDKSAEKWDCESILSKNSTFYNHPCVIKEPIRPKPIKLSTKLAMSGGLGLTIGNVKALNAATGSGRPKAGDEPSERSTVFSVRTKDETPEERRLRKRAIKDMRRERRAEKKANKMAFKEEQIKQEKVLLNLEQNLKGIKLR